MKYFTLLCTICSLLIGCAHSEGTIARGIEYGMTQDQVIANLEPSQTVLSRGKSKIVTEGQDGFWGMKRRNIFLFQNGKLVAHENNLAESD